MSVQRNQGWLEIKEALQLDDNGQDEKAFTKYLEGVQKLCTYIKDETNLLELQSNGSTRISVLKILSTMKESLTRVENIISKPDPLKSNIENSICDTNLSSGVETTQSLSSVTANSRSLPMEIAQKQNSKLWKTYQNRCQNMKDPAQRVTLSLELQRRMQENLAVARERASKYRQEQSKKEAEALHLAASKLANSCLPNESGSDRHGWSNKVALCACVLHYRPEDNWIQSFLKQFRENPSQGLVIAAVRRILRTGNHPLTTWLYGKQGNLKDRLSSVLSQQVTRDTRMAEFVRGQVTSNSTDLLSMFDPVQNLSVDTMEPVSTLKEVAQEINSILETFLQIFAVSLELSDCGEYVDGCYLTLEQQFFHELWPVIIKLYRHIYKEEETTLSAVCQRFKSGTDTDVNISDLLSLPAQKLDAIFVDLQQFLSKHSPLAKVHSLVEISHILCENDTTLKYEKVLSADDLIGLVSCLLVQSNVPHLYAEFEALEQFIPHRFLLGEEGYSLTTFLTAVRYLESQGETWKQGATPTM